MTDDKILAERQKTYTGFVYGSLISGACVVVVLVLMAIFLL